MSRTKAWCFTSYNESEPAYDRSIHQYLVFGLETCAATARRHYQGYVVLRERKRVTQLRQMFPNAHLAAARGSPQQAAAYCKKGGQYTEYGRLPSAAAGSGAFADVLRAAEDGDIAAIKDAHPGVFLRYKTNILSSRRFDVAELNASCGVWICGPPRCGKDRGVLALGDVFSKGVTKWWDGYAGEKYVLLSDVEPSHGPLLGFYLKIWADRYPFGAEVKGSSIRIRPKKVFVTSNFTMAECFSDRILDALRARFSQFDKFDDSYTPRPAFAADASLHAWLLEKEDGLASTDAPTSERPLLCWTVAGSAIIASIVATGCISYANDLTPMFVGIGSASDYDIYRNRLVRTWDLIYTKPYCRIGPYLVGMLLAHRIHGRTYRQPLTMASKVVGWCGACACCVGVVYGAWFLGEGGAMPHIYNALSRPMFGGGVAWIVYCCATHNADLVGRLLSWGAWAPLSRLSFCAYLLHPVLMSWYFDSQEEPLHFTHANWVMLYIAFLVVSYAVAFVVSITLEAPIINIEKMMKRGR